MLISGGGAASEPFVGHTFKGFSVRRVDLLFLSIISSLQVLWYR